MPDDFHGIMHLTQEMTCANAALPTLSVIRPSAVYVLGDPHKAYGPNRFARCALRDRSIPLLGSGSSIRDHISGTDVARIVCQVAECETAGIFNAVTGESRSFFEVATIVRENCDIISSIYDTGPERQPTYRYYDVCKREAISRDLVPALPENGIADFVRALSVAGT